MLRNVRLIYLNISNFCVISNIQDLLFLHCVTIAMEIICLCSSKLFQLTLKSFSYFHGFCMRKSPSFLDGLVSDFYSTHQATSNFLNLGSKTDSSCDYAFVFVVALFGFSVVCLGNIEMQFFIGLLYFSVYLLYQFFNGTQNWFLKELLSCRRKILSDLCQCLHIWCLVGLIFFP